MECLTVSDHLLLAAYVKDGHPGIPLPVTFLGFSPFVVPGKPNQLATLAAKTGWGIFLISALTISDGQRRHFGLLPTPKWSIPQHSWSIGV